MFGTFTPLGFLAAVTKQDGRALEQLLAPGGGVPIDDALGGAIVDASYVRSDPPLLARLAEAGIPWVVNPQSMRFATARFSSVTGLGDLPYAPSAPLSTESFGSREKAMVKAALEFQADHEPSAYLVPALPLAKVSIKTFRAFQELHQYAADLNGSKGIPYRPMIAAGFPSYAVIRGRFGVFDRLDRTFAGTYVQCLQLNPKGDSVEKLVAFVRFLEEAATGSPPVIAGRVGPFGVVLAAFGIDLFESSIDSSASFSLSRLERPPRPQKAPGKRSGGRDKSVYFASLKTAIPNKLARILAENPAFGSQLGCTIGECRHAGRLFAAEKPRPHLLHTRFAELAELRRLPTASMRVPVVHAWLKSAANTARMINRARLEGGEKPLDFDHLDRWLGVLARVATVAAADER